MSISKRKERQKEELKGKILQEAKLLFLEKGYEETSIRNIAERIEYSPTTIYLYFKDKDDIFYALHQEGFALMNQYFKPLAFVKDPFERLLAMNKAYVTFALENPELYDLMFISRSPINSVEKDKGNWEEGDNAFAFLQNTITECIAHGFFEKLDPEILAYTTWSMVHGICSLEIRCRHTVVSELNQKELIHKASDMINEIYSRVRKSKP